MRLTLRTLLAYLDDTLEPSQARLIGQKVASEEVMRWSDRLRNGGGILFGLAGLLWILEKVGLRVAGARCRACRKPIAHGKTYCADDMRKFVEQGRERLHQHRGSGV